MGDSKRWEFDGPRKSAAEGSTVGNRAPDAPAVRPVVAAKFDFKDLQSRVVFGTVVGMMSGISFGLMDHYNKVQRMTNLRTTRERTHFVINGTARAAGMFTGFYAGYQALRYGLDTFREKTPVNAAIAGGTAALPVLLWNRQVLRSNLPYLLILVGLDVYHSEYKFS